MLSVTSKLIASILFGALLHLFKHEGAGAAPLQEVHSLVHPTLRYPANSHNAKAIKDDTPMSLERKKRSAEGTPNDPYTGSKQLTRNVKLTAEYIAATYCEDVHHFLPWIDQSAPAIEQCESFADIVTVMTSLPPAHPSAIATSKSDVIEIQRKNREMLSIAQEIVAYGSASLLKNNDCVNYQSNTNSPCVFDCLRLERAPEQNLYCHMHSQLLPLLTNAIDVIDAEFELSPASEPDVTLDVTAETSAAKLRFYNVAAAEFLKEQSKLIHASMEIYEPLP